MIFVKKKLKLLPIILFISFTGSADALADYSNGVIAMMFGQSDYAISEFKKAAAEGHMEATYSLGYMYENSVGVPKNYPEALKWYKAAAALGDPKSQYILGNMYNRGRGVEINYEQAVNWYRLSAEQGYAWAEYFLGLKLETGQGTSKDLESAAYWYERAADQEHARAQYNLAKIYYQGNGVKQDFLKAYKWAVLADSYGEGDAKSLMLILEKNLSENEILKSKSDAKKWIREHR
ncbi:MAG: tetratricopeptide repeat protein [Emcibacteraceae bacterium]